MILHPAGELNKLSDLLALSAGESASVPQRLYQIARSAENLFSADFYSLVPFNPETRAALDTISLVAGAVASAAKTADLRSEAVARHILARGAVLIADLAERPDLQERFTAVADVSAMAAIPLTTRPSGSPLAVLYLDYRHPQSFTPQDLTHLQFFADQAALALQQTWLLHRYAEVTRLGQAINSGLTTIDNLFAHLRKGIAPLLDCSYVFLLAIYQRETDTLDLYYAERGEAYAREHEPLNGACRWVITHKRPLLIQHFSVEQPDLPVALRQLPGTGEHEESLIFVPLLFRDQALGVLSVQHPEPNYYDDEDRQVLELLGNQVALALNTIRLFNGLTQLNAAGQELVRTLDLKPEDLAQRVVDLIRESSRADLVNLYTVDHGQLSPHPVTSGDLRVPDYTRILPPRQDDMALLALRHTGPIYAAHSARLFNELGGDQVLRRGGFNEREQIQSTATLALRVRDDAVGVLFVNYRRPQRFDAFQRQIIESLASYAAIAIRNAGQYDTVNRNRVIELEALQQIDHALSQSLDLDAVMGTIIRFAQERTGADEASVVLWNEITRQLECRSSVGVNADYRRAWMTDPTEERNIISWVFNHRKTARSGDVHREPPWSTLYDQVDPRVFSEMDVPLIDGDNVVGVINLESFRAHAFGPEEQQFIETLAGQAVLALKNAQAYAREQRVADERAALVQIGAEIVRRLRRDEVFTRILGEALKLTRAPVGTLHLYDEERRVLRMVANQGVSPQHIEHASEIQLGEGVLGVAAANRQIVRVDDTTLPPWDVIHLPYIPDVRAELAVPLIDGDRLCGVLNLESTRPRHFTEHDSRLLLAFADLAVIALQNTELYTEAERQRQRAEQGQARFRLLYDAGRRLTAVTDERAAYAVVTSIAQTHLDCRVVGRRYRPETQLLEPIAEFGNRPGFPAFPLRSDEGLNGRVAHDHTTIVVTDLNALEQELPPPRISDPQTRSVIVTPVLFEQIYYGNLAFSHATVGYFDDADVELIESLAQQLGTTLYRLEVTAARQEAQQRMREAEAMTAIGQAAYELAHRLGNDLGPISTLVNQIRAELQNLGVNSERVTRNLDLIISDKDRVVRLIRRLKEDLSKERLIGDRTAATERSTPLLVRELLEETSRSYSLLPETIEVVIDCAEPVGPILASYRQTTDILRNLFTNAVEALPSGGHVTLRARDNGAVVLIEVVDNGPGIAKFRLGRIFDLFYSTKPEGTGFGLWSARRNALANGGELTVQSRQGEGATFTLSLPRATEPNEAAI